MWQVAAGMVSFPHSLSYGECLWSWCAPHLWTSIAHRISENQILAACLFLTYAALLPVREPLFCFYRDLESLGLWRLLTSTAAPLENNFVLSGVKMPHFHPPTSGCHYQLLITKHNNVYYVCTPKNSSRGRKPTFSSRSWSVGWLWVGPRGFREPWNFTHTPLPTLLTAWGWPCPCAAVSPVSPPWRAPPQHNLNRAGLSLSRGHSGVPAQLQLCPPASPGCL